MNNDALTVLAIIGLVLVPVVLVLIAIETVRQFFARFVRFTRVGSTVVIQSEIEIKPDKDQVERVVRELLKTGRREEAVQLYRDLMRVELPQAEQTVNVIGGQPQLF